MVDEQNKHHCKCSENEREEMKKKIEELEKKNEDYLNGWKRAKADYINYKKEIDENKKEMMGFAFASVVMQFLPVYDNMETAFKHIPKDLEKIEWTMGIENIKKQFESIMKD